MKLPSGIVDNLAIAQLWQVTLVIAAAGLVARLGCRRRPHLAYLVWLVVLIKCLTPPLWSSLTGVFSWTMPRGGAPTNHGASLTLRSMVRPAALQSAAPTEDRLSGGRTVAAGAVAMRTGQETSSTSASPIPKPAGFWSAERVTRALWAMWGAGALVYVGFALLAAIGYWRRIHRYQVPCEERLDALLQTLTERLCVRRKTRAVLLSEPLGPMTFGWFRPTIVVPEALVAGGSTAEIEPLLAHELVHIRRGDTAVGLLQMVAQALWWFHPLVWWANRQMVLERERCCDEEVVAGLAIQPALYARCLVNVLELKGQLRWLRSLPGLRRFEITKHRLEHLMQHSAGFRARMPRPYWLMLLAGVLLLTPGARLDSSVEKTRASSTKPQPSDQTDAERKKQEKGAQNSGKNQSLFAQADRPARKTVARKALWPVLVETVPKRGQTNVSADLQEIRVTFDRDMGGGMSWTGSPPFFPPAPPADGSLKSGWIDRRTCVLPVRLEKGSYYRLGINASGFKNFRSAHGEPALPAVIYFTTEGATAEVESRLRVPKVILLQPPNESRDVDPATESLLVRFDVTMVKGMSWTGGGPSFPKISPDRRPGWTKNEMNCILPVRLEPGHSYRIGLNSLGAINFQSEWGVPLEPVVYQFKTREK